jgi:peptidoglycan/LPS O-acetylase OafA/YrhL
MGMATESMQQKGVTLSSYGTYLKKRFLRISIPYYVSMAFWIVAINIFHLLPKSASWYDIVTHILYNHNFNLKTMYSISGVFWSLAVEMQFYLILPVLMIYFQNNLKRIALITILFATSLFIHIVASDNIILTWGLASYLSVFVLGWMLYLNKVFLAKHLAGRIQLWSILFLYISMMFVDPSFLKVNKFYEILVSSVCGFLMISIMSQKSDGNMRQSIFLKAVSWLGRVSFSIYLYNYIYVAFGFPDKNSYGLPLVIFIFLFGVFMYFLVEKPYESMRRKRLRSGTSTLDEST